MQHILQFWFLFFWKYPGNSFNLNSKYWRTLPVKTLQELLTENLKSEWVSEWVSDCCLTPIQQLCSYIMTKTSYFKWDDDEVRFELDQHAALDFYSASSLKQQSAGRHVGPLWYIIVIPTQPVFVLSP